MKTRKVLLVSLLAILIAGGVAAQLPPAPNTITVSLVPDPVGGPHLLLRLEASEVTDLYGLSFDLKFPKKRLRWKKNSCVPGSFLTELDTVGAIAIDRQKPRGTIHVGVSRVGEVPGVSGSGILLDIGFINKAKAGPRTLTLSQTLALDSNAELIPEIIWEVIPFVNTP